MAAKNSYRNSRRRETLSELFSDPPMDTTPKGSDLVRDVVAEMNSTPREEIDRQIDEAETEETQLKKLIPGETQIGTKTGMIQGELRQIRIYYGNFINPMNIHNGKYVPLKKKEYLKILNEFLDSEEGKEYQRPDEEDINRAFVEVKESVNRYIESQNRKQPGMMQPGRSQAAGISRKEETSEEDKGGQPQESTEQQHFADDLSEEERKEVEFIQTRQYTKQQMKEIRKGFDSERRRSTLGTALIIVIALLILGVAVFLIKDLVVKMHALIELELKQNEITIRAGDSFNAADYVKYVTEDESIYIIYPTLDTQDLGEHRVDFVATNGVKNVRKTMVVTVIDGESPVIVLSEEEIRLVRDRDEEGFDPLKYVAEVHDNIDSDEDLYVEVNPLDWSKDEQSLSYRVKDSAGNAGSAILLVKIEDKTVCDANAYYNATTNTCTCKSGYTGDGTACKIVTSGSNSNSAGTSNSGNSGNGNSNSGNSTAGTGQSYTIDYEDYQPSNGDYNVTITDNNTGQSTTVTTQDPPPPGSSDDEFFDWINDQLP